MTATTYYPSDNRNFDAAAAAEQCAMNIALPLVATMKAETLAVELRKMPALTNHAARITEICSRDKPDLEELRQALLDQCRELTQAKQRQASGNSRRTIGNYADRCLDVATDCRRAMESSNSSA